MVSTYNQGQKQKGLVASLVTPHVRGQPNACDDVRESEGILSLNNI